MVKLSVPSEIHPQGTSCRNIWSVQKSSSKFMVWEKSQEI